MRNVQRVGEIYNIPAMLKLSDVLGILIYRNNL